MFFGKLIKRAAAVRKVDKTPTKVNPVALKLSIFDSAPRLIPAFEDEVRHLLLSKHL